MCNYQTDDSKSSGGVRDGVPRKDAEWMVPVDDRILELIQEKGNLNPAAIEQFDVTSANHASRRCSKLAEYGLLDRMAPGLYALTDEGLAYLNRELDASELQRDHEE